METESKTKLGKKAALAILIAILSIALIIAAVFLIDGRRTEIVLNGEENILAEYGSDFTDPGASAVSRGRIFGEKPGKDEIHITGKVDTHKLGEQTIEYSTKDCKVTRTVTVQDTTPPVIELVHKPDYSPSWFTGYEEEGFSAHDACDGIITGKVTRTEYPDRIEYTVTDRAGNTTTAERRLEGDLAAPTITLVGGDMEFNAGTKYSEPGFTAVDGGGNDLSRFVSVSGEVNPYKAGTYEIVYSITNFIGDTVSAKRTVNVKPQYKPDIVQPGEKTIYLTFDDGPGPYTGALLDVLAAYGVKVTFFVTDTDSDYRDMIAREYSEGHTVAVHTACHDYYTIYASEDAFFADFNKMEELIYAETGEYTKLCRFPGGSSNTVSRFNPGIMTRLTEAVNDMGYKYFDWNVDSNDAGGAKSAEEVFNNITSGCSGKTACIVLQHDIKGFSVDAVERVIIWGLENGYTFRALDMTSPEAHHGVNN